MNNIRTTMIGVSTMKKYVGYTRVSTDKQGKEGYGSADQLQTINEFVKNDELLQVFQEEESGSKNNRPQLTQALELCKKEKAILVIARLDRLSRNLAFTASLMESNIEFVCCDMPSVNKFTIQVLAAVAEQYLDTLRKKRTRLLNETDKLYDKLRQDIALNGRRTLEEYYSPKKHGDFILKKIFSNEKI